MDIKKVLAYSTVSQLGYMFLAVGVGAYWVAIFHMVTHAFFKALLFLGSGSVIHGMHDEQDMRRMGALRKLMPITAGTMIIGWLAIAGIPPFSGFWSKDEILGKAWAMDAAQGKALWLVGTIVAVMTAYYMTRMVFRTFFGDELWKIAPVPHGEQTLAEAFADIEDDEQRAAIKAAIPDIDLAFDPEPAHGHIDAEYHPHESPWTMTAPLVVLAFFAVFAGFLSIPFGSANFLEKWLEPVFEAGVAPEHAHNMTEVVVLLLVGALVAVAGCAAGYLVWGKRNAAQRNLEPALFGNAWYYDLSVSKLMEGPGAKLADGLAWFDRTVIDGAVNGVGVLVVEAASAQRRLQSGYLRRYALGIGMGTVCLLAFLVTKVVTG